MIVAVEGASAAGKTTWCSARRTTFVAEYAPTGTEPDDQDPVAQAQYWVSVNSGRWKAAVELEQATGLAICDSDPLKLHYSWCLAVIGAATSWRFELEYQRTREAFTRSEVFSPDR